MGADLQIVRRLPPGIVVLRKASENTSLREGGGLGRSPKTEGAIGHNANLIDRGGTSPGLSNPINHFLGKLS